MIKKKLLKNAKEIDRFLINFLKNKIFFASQTDEVWSNIWRKKNKINNNT